MTGYTIASEAGVIIAQVSHHDITAHEASQANSTIPTNGGNPMSQLTAIRIDEDGTLTVCQLEPTPEGSLLHAMYAALDVRTIETFELPGHIDVIFDEEGKLTGAQPNDRGTVTALMLGGRFLPGDYIAGPALFLGYTDDGEHVGLTEDQMRRILTASID